MNPLLTDILSSVWLLDPERARAYAGTLLGLLHGEANNDADFSMQRERNRPYILSMEDDEVPKRHSMGDQSIPSGSIAVIPIRGEIMKYDVPCGPRGSASIANDIKDCDANGNIKSILLVIDSPGGQVTYTDILADVIKNCSKPVVAYVEGMAASAAYWIASSASKVIASSELDRIGSIGTMLFFADLKPYYEEMGVKFHEFYASKSTDKNKDINDVLEGKYNDYRKNTLDKINEKFLETVKANRPSIDDGALTGKMFFANDAIAMGLIDSIGTMEYALEECNAMGDDCEEEPEPPEVEITNTYNNMKILKAAYTAILAFFAIPTEEADQKELTPEMVEQLNEELQLRGDRVSALEAELEEATNALKERTESLTAAESQLAAVTKEFEDFKASDATGETRAIRDKDEFPEEEEVEANYKHNKVADKL